MALSPDNPNWWQGSLLYEVYIRSYCDSNGDGIGDLAGLTSKLPYIASLGADAVWITPFFKSPMKDFGYDVSDYCLVEPLFGNNDDAKTLIKTAHNLGIRIFIDQVWNHTSDQHPWFIESRSSKTNPKHDWYVWVDAKPDGSPPNNWLSVFGGSAWQWDSRRRQYYLHSFLKEQPDLNWYNPDVQKAMFDAARFWLDIGVDGIRFDVPYFLFYDKQLRDNPPRPAGMAAPDGFPDSNPFSWQLYKHSIFQPETLAFMSDIRAFMDKYPGTATIAEMNGGYDSIRSAAEYVAGNNRLHLAYTGAMLQDNFPGAIELKNIIQKVEQLFPHGAMSWTMTNHDSIRVATRWKPHNASLTHAFNKMLAAFILSMRGSICLYQGDELGLTEADIPFDLLQDPYGIAMYPEFKGRDGCRTPMPWLQSGISAGFSTNPKTWLPIPDDHRANAVDVQDRDPASLLNTYRALVKWRKSHEAMVHGKIELLSSPDHIVAFRRYMPDTPEQAMLCVYNMSDGEAEYSLPEGYSVDVGCPQNTSAFAHGMVTLPAYGFFLAEATVEEGIAAPRKQHAMA